MGGGGGGTTQQQNQYQSLAPWAQPYVTSVLGAAQQQVFKTDPTTGQLTGIQPYTAYGVGGAGQSAAEQAAAQSSVAGFTPLQNQAFTGAAGMTTPGQFGQATTAAGQGIGQALGAGADYASMATSPYAMGAYMNPYVSASLAPQLAEIQRTADINSQRAASQATAAGAFGGTRGQLAQAEAQRAGQLAQQQAISQGYNTAYQQAQQAMQYGAGLGLQGAQAGIQGAGQLANIGTGQLAAQQGILGLQNQYGTQQQQQQQNIINQAMQNYLTQQQYPMQQLGQLKSLVTGLPISDVTTTQQQAAPSAGSQLAGLAATGVGAYGAAGGFKAKGGVIKEKKFNVGGAIFADLKGMDKAHLQDVVKTTTSDAIRREAAQLLSELELQEAQGITGARSNLNFSDGGILNFQPVNTDDSEHEYAGGGIIAFERGGLTPGMMFEDPYGGAPYEDTAARNKVLGTKEALKNLEEAKKAKAAADAARAARTTTAAAKGIEALSPWEKYIAPNLGKAGAATKSLPARLISAPVNVASGIVEGGGQLSGASANTLRAMSPELRQQLAEGNQGDASLAAGILNQADNSKPIAKWIPDWMLPEDLKQRRDIETGKKVAPKEPAKVTPAAPAAATKATDDGLGLDDTGGFGGTGGAGGIDAAFGNTPLGRMRAEAYRKLQEADLKSSKAQADLDKQREEIEANKEHKFWMALMKGGAETMAGTSPHAFTNIGRGVSGGIEDLAKAEAAERAEKKLLIQYQTALDQADYARKSGNFTALEQIQGRLDQLKIARAQINATKEAALIGAKQKSFGDLVAKLMYQNSMTEEQAIALATKLYAQGAGELPENVTVKKIGK